MSKQRKFVHLLASIGVIAVGLYMFFSYAWPTPPAVSGLGFFSNRLSLVDESLSNYEISVRAKLANIK
jgi:hypothetical protein